LGAGEKPASNRLADYTAPMFAAWIEPGGLQVRLRSFSLSVR
jgi:hypothetical protein